MKQKESGVFFIDILGFSALTKGQIKDISKKDFQAWGLKKTEYDLNFLSAKIILEFRSVLKRLKEKYPAINIGQLSDCAFIWSDDIVLLIQAVHFMMWTMIGEKGVLCRGGLSYGNIVEIDDVDYELGAFIVGNPATNAVKNEGRLKGPRVTMDLTITDKIQESFRKDSLVMQLSHDLFHNIESMIDMNQVDEYRWYLFDDDIITSSSIGIIDLNTRIQLTKQRLKLANVLQFHPRMRWNTLSEDGRIQLKAGIKSLTKNKLLDIFHYFKRNDIYNVSRTKKHLSLFNLRVDKNKYFTKKQYNEWSAGLEDLD
jgi:hypothetical protein